MLRRSKIKARPVIKKTKTPNPRPSAVQRTPNTSGIAKSTGKPQNENINCESSQTADQEQAKIQPQPNKLDPQETDTGNSTGCKDLETVQPSTAALQVMPVQKIIKSSSSPADQSINCQGKDSSSDCSSAPKPQNVRRRKIIACPSTNAKRAKLNNVNVRSSLKTERPASEKTLVSGHTETPRSDETCSNESSHFRSENDEQNQKLSSGSHILINEPGSQECSSPSVSSTSADYLAVCQSSSQNVSHSKTEQSAGENESKLGGINSRKTLPHIGRRRKVIACPTIGKRKPKSDSQTCSTIANSQQCASGAVAVVNPVCTDSLPFSGEVHQPELTSDFIPVPPIQVAAVVETVTDEPSEDVALLTTVTCTDSPDVFMPALESGRARNDESELVVSCDMTQSQLASSNVEPMNIDDTSRLVDQNSSIENAHQALELPLQTAQQSKKCASKGKAKSLSYQYRNKAMEKLKKLKRDQNDSNKWPELDQNYVSMSDLIFLNPPAEEGNKLGMNVENDEEQESIPVVQPSNTEESQESTAESQDTSSLLPTPQIRIAEDGTVVVDEESLVLDTQKPVDPTKRTVYESGRDNMLNQRSFMRRTFPKALRWSVEDTDKFYKCLQIVGAEFSLMSAMFRTRSSDDLRRKFRRERKLNPIRVDEALMQQHLTKWSDDMFEMPQSQSAVPVQSPQQVVK